MNKKSEKYLRFGAMILTSMAVMFVFMYLNTYSLDHVHFSETRFYMTLIMGAAMSAIMLLYMISMYENKKLNIFILAVSVIVLPAALLLVRSQALVGDRSYMAGMIPHHSIAILTSDRANIDDVRVRELADGIIKAQRKEIKEMEWLLDDIAANGAAKTQTEAQARPVPEFTGEL